MKCVTVGVVVLFGLLTASCSVKPDKERLSALEAQCLQSYCGSNAIVAEAALLDCIRYAQACQKVHLEGIHYDEIFARLYGRLYLVQRHLRHDREAEATLEKYAHFHAVRSSLARQLGRPSGEMASLIEHKYDSGLKKAWAHP